MRLPISFFAVRKVGQTVARVRELENVRNFITGSGLTLIVDLGFTVVFFAVMVPLRANAHLDRVGLVALLHRRVCHCHAGVTQTR